MGGLGNALLFGDPPLSEGQGLIYAPPEFGVCSEGRAEGGGGVRVLGEVPEGGEGTV